MSYYLESGAYTAWCSGRAGKKGAVIATEQMPGLSILAVTPHRLWIILPNDSSDQARVSNFQKIHASIKCSNQELNPNLVVSRFMVPLRTLSNSHHSAPWPLCFQDLRYYGSFLALVGVQILSKKKNGCLVVGTYGMDKRDELQDARDLDPNLSSTLEQLVTETNSAHD